MQRPFHGTSSCDFGFEAERLAAMKKLANSLPRFRSSPLICLLVLVISDQKLPIEKWEREGSYLFLLNV